MSAASESPASIILFAHGSAVAAANRAVEQVAEQLSARAGCPVVAAFLEKAQPDLPAAVARLAGAGANRVIIVPYFLTMGIHISEDLPKLARHEQERFAGLRVDIAAPMEGHALLLDVLVDRMRQAARVPESGARG
jgi:sirohydrochlorin ferrochelatase